MRRRDFLNQAATAAAAACMPRLVCSADPPAPPPSFLIIMVDDLGYGDVSCHGGSTPTPNIDRLFQQGVELTNFMTWAVCSPTRAGLLTCVHPLTLDQGPYTDGRLSQDTPTLGDHFRAHGYRTGIFGKWHNSVTPRVDPDAPHINDFGFDRWVGFYGGGIDYFTKVWPNRPETPDWWHDRIPVDDERDYATDLLADYAIEFMQEVPRQPFFCYVPFNTVHTPHHVRPQDLERVPRELIEAAGGRRRSWETYYKLVNDQQFPVLNEAYMRLTGNRSIATIAGRLSDAELRVLYAAMLINLDDNVGRLLEALEATGRADTTVVWFFSDNGGVPRIASNAPFRGHKHTVWEGGIHSPAVVRWPAGGCRGPRQYGGLLGYLDVGPTCLDMAGLAVSDASAWDGASVLGALRADTPSPVAAYRYVWRDHDAVRTPQWKLMRYATRRELYDLVADSAEQTDVSARFPLVVRALCAEQDTWLRERAIRPGHLRCTADRVDMGGTGDALTLRFTVGTGPPAAGGDVIQVAGPAGEAVQTGDRLVYDIRIGAQSPAAGFHLTPLFRQRSLFLSHGFVDQHGQLHTPGYSYEDARGRWVQRVVGLANLCPRPLTPLCLVLTGAVPGSYVIGLRNLLVQRRDGRAVPYWTGGPPQVRVLRAKTVSDLVVESPGAPREIDPATFEPPGAAMTVVAEHHELTVQRATVDGVDTWTSGRRSAGGKLTFFYLQAPEQLRHGRGSDQVLTVVYRDVGRTWVDVVYDAEQGVWTRAGGFHLGATGSWRAVSMRLPDPRFSGRCNGHDVRLNIREPTTDPVLVGAYLSPVPRPPPAATAP